MKTLLFLILLFFTNIIIGQTKNNLILNDNIPNFCVLNSKSYSSKINNDNWDLKNYFDVLEQYK